MPAPKTDIIGPPPSDFVGVALEKWKEVSAILNERGTATSDDRGALQILCLAFAAHQRATETIERMGDVLESERGFTRNPACLNQTGAAGTIAKLSAQFGLTPASRGKLKTPQKQEANPFESL